MIKIHYETSNGLVTSSLDEALKKEAEYKRYLVERANWHKHYKLPELAKKYEEVRGKYILQCKTKRKTVDELKAFKAVLGWYITAKELLQETISDYHIIREKIKRCGEFKNKEKK